MPKSTSKLRLCYRWSGHLVLQAVDSQWCFDPIPALLKVEVLGELKGNLKFQVLVWGKIVSHKLNVLPGPPVM